MYYQYHWHWQIIGAAESKHLLAFSGMLVCGACRLTVFVWDLCREAPVELLGT